MNHFPQFSQIKRILFCVLVLIFATTTVYFNSLKGSFQFDDSKSLERIWVSNLDEYQKRVKMYALNEPGGYEKLYLSLYHSISARPTLLFTWALNNTLGKNNPWGFHLLNLIFHIFTTILVFFVLRLAFKISHEFQERETFFALVSSFVFAIHPALTESVTYISSRSSELLTFFYLLGILYFLQFFQSNSTNKLFIPIRILFISACFYLSLTSKIVAATFPVALILLFIFLICPKKYPNLYQKLTSPSFLLGYAFLLISILALVSKIPVHDKGKEVFGSLGYLCIQIKIIVFYYLKILLWPINLNVDISYPFTTPQNDLTIIFAALMGLGLIIFAGLKGGKWSKICAGWFILTLAPTSSILPLNDLAVEHRLYLPVTLGICPLFALAVQTIPKNKRYSFLFFLLVSFAVLTAERNKVWTSEFNLWQDAIKKSPHSGRPYSNLGKAYYEKDNIDLALEYLKKSVELSDLLATTHYNIANIYMDKEKLGLSEKEYKRAIELNPKYYQAFLGLGSIQNQIGKLKEAEKNYLRAIEIRSTMIAQDEDYALARLNLGEVYGKMGQFKDSIRQSEIALKSIPNSFKAHYNIGTANMKLGKLEKAKEAFLYCLKINPEFENALFNLAYVYQKMGQFESSNQFFSKFLNVKKSFPNAYVSMGINYAQMNQLNQAINSFKNALALNPKILNARTLLAKALSQEGKTKEAIEQLEIILAQNPNLNAIRIQLGIMYWKKENRPNRAKNLFETALKLSVNPNERLQVSSWLKELSK